MHKKPPGFQIRKKYSNRCFRKFDRQYVGLYLFHLFIFWSKGKMLLFLKESWHSVDKGDYTLIQKTGFLVRRTQSFYLLSCADRLEICFLRECLPPWWIGVNVGLFIGLGNQYKFLESRFVLRSILQYYQTVSRPSI